MKRQKSASALNISDRPLSKEEIIQDILKFRRSVAFHGKKEDLDKILVHIPYHYALKMDNGIRPEYIIGSQQYYDHEPFSAMVPPAWYSEFCAYCDEHKDQKCALLIYDLTKCEPSNQVVLNSLLQNRSLRPDLWPLPSNSSVFVMVENKDEVDYQYYNLDVLVNNRLGHIFLDEKWMNKPETKPSPEAGAEASAPSEQEPLDRNNDDDEENGFIINISDKEWSIEEFIEDYLRFPSEIAFFGKKKELDRVLGQIPYFLTLEMDNGITPETILGSQKYSNHNPYLVPPAWYSEFCAFCDQYSDQKCALIIRGLTKCEPLTQVYLNNILGERSVRLDCWPLPSNSSVFVMVEDKDEADYQYYNITERVFRRIVPFYLKEYKWKDELEADSSSEDK